MDIQLLLSLKPWR